MRVPVSVVETPRWGIPFTREAAPPPTLTELPPPSCAIVPLLQHTGSAAQPLISVGDRVLTGQPIGEVKAQTLGARVHAPVAGTVTAIETGPVPGRRPALCVHIDADGSDERWPGYRPLSRPLSLSTSALRQAVIEAGIVGLGGATFPAGVKLNRGSGVNTLILNAAECEPTISCDEALLLHDCEPMLLGAQVMLRILEADQCIVALKQGSDDALGRLTAAIDRLNDDRFRIALVPRVYPVGGEAQLIQLLTGTEIPSGGLPWDSGAICQNVGTAAAIARFLTQGEPLISRIVTVTGQTVAQPGNFRVRVGTPLRELLSTAGQAGPATLIMGGPMMGVELDSDQLPVTKATNCIYAAAPNELATKPAAEPCIRCGDCARVCPAGLMPQLLLQTVHTRDYDRLQDLGLPDCIECGCCDYVCPSHIPLTAQFVEARRQLWQIGFEKQRARRAAERVAARTARLKRDAEEAVNAIHDVTDARAELDELLRRTESEEPE